MKRYKTLAIGLTFAALSLSFLAGYNNVGLKNYAVDNNYVLQLNSTNGNITSGSYSNASLTAKTKLGNNVSFSYANGMSRTNAIGQIKSDTGSYYMNTSPILGLTKIELNFAFSSETNAVATLSVGTLSGSTFSATYSQDLTATTSATTQTFTDFGGDFSYFKIQTGSGNKRAIYINYINVYYSCIETNVEEEIINVDSVSVDPKTLPLVKGQTFGLTKDILPENATNKGVTWSSNNNNVATVDEDGLVTAIGKGNATITCKTDDGGKTDTCLVTVSEEEQTTSSYKLVTSEDQLTADASVVMVSRSAQAIAGTLSSSYLSSVEFNTLNTETTEFTNLPEGAIEFTLEGSEGAWKFKYIDSYLGSTAVKKVTFSGGTTTWSISISSELATIQNTTSEYGRFLYNSDSPRFTTYTSSTSDKMLLPELFIKTTGNSETTTPEEPEPEEPAPTLSFLAGTLNKTTYAYGETFNKNSVNLVGTFSDGTTQTYGFDDADEYVCFDSNINDVNLDEPLSVAGEYALSFIINDIESNTLSFFVEEEENDVSTSNATITILNGGSNVSDDLSSQAINYINFEGIKINSVTGSKIYSLGSGVDGFKLGSGKAVGSITFNFDSVVITGISLKIGRYSEKTANIKVSTSANSTGETFELSQDYTSNGYICSNFSTDTSPSSSLTISSISGSNDLRFHLYAITLTIGVAQEIPVTGVNLPISTLSLGVGDTYTLNPNILPNNATNKGVTWSSNKTSVATVSDTGIVSAVSKGEATITVTTKDGGYTDSLSVTVSEISYNSYYKATVVDPDINLKQLMETQDSSAIPSGEGTRNILVIPVELTDYPFSNATLEDLEVAFNGASEDTYWESVSSFYYKSSYQKINLEFEIADVFESGYSAKTMADISTNNNYPYFTNKVLEYAVDDYISTNGNTSTQKFDSDKDGFIDAVWMIYSCPNHSNSATIENISTDYWAYVYWNNWNETASVTSPKAGAYGWASYDFMYDKGNNQIDSHTYIHETGHLFGLDDYYNYDDDSNRVSLAGVDMMDYNVIDHNSWSKMLLGWTKPYIVTGNAEITINPAVENGDCILIPSSSGWNGTSYDEFILLELYVPSGLNEKDAVNGYNSANIFKQAGVRLYHVDSRLGKFTYSYSDSEWSFSGYIEPENVNTSAYNTYFAPAHSNTPSFSADADYQLIHMIQADNSNTYKNGGNADDNDLFKTGNTFSMAKYGSNFFPNGTKFNNGETFDYTITFVNVSSTSATIRIIKN